MARDFDETLAQAATPATLARVLGPRATDGGHMTGGGVSNAINERGSQLAVLIERHQTQNAELDQLCTRLERMAEVIIGPAPPSPERLARDKVRTGDEGPPMNAMHALRQLTAATEYFIQRMQSAVSRLEDL